eukprot:TRINITY_DN25909_c0_g1_i2.p1 TRINITY_DN25909_c0_g1~~TRINITY_DN25909_c0_g1_i2.p1  ORF type:complete len:207 (+),score=29.50 TRINITY_DN25909_c0_g1_i2:302-922(+)
MAPTDLEIFLRIARFLTVRRAFVIGNAWGYSAIALAALFNGSAVDVLDGGQEGADNMRGIDLTSLVASQAHLDVSVTLGFSPQATPRALRGSLGSYDLVFIDAGHSDRQVLADFAAVIPYLAPSAAVVFHDAGLWDLWGGIARCICFEPRLFFLTVDEGKVEPRARVVLAYRGLPNASVAFMRGRGRLWNALTSRNMCVDNQDLAH